MSVEDVDANRRANEKSARRQEARQKMMAEKTREKGLIIVHTGKGKGKSSAAFGMVMRCVGHGMKAGVVQFIKGKWETGERKVLERFPRSLRDQGAGRGLHLGHPGPRPRHRPCRAGLGRGAADDGRSVLRLRAGG